MESGPRTFVKWGWALPSSSGAARMSHFTKLKPEPYLLASASQWGLQRQLGDAVT